MEQTQKTFFCPTAGKTIPKEHCLEACYICTKANRDGKETYHWSG